VWRRPFPWLIALLALAFALVPYATDNVQLRESLLLAAVYIVLASSLNLMIGYAGYVNYIKTISQGWGWAPTTNTTLHTATDANRLDTKVQYVGKFGDAGCSQTIVTVPHPTYTPKYRFTIYFPNNVPTNSYAITLVGFDP